MKRIGITGGIGAGKTTVCRIFESLDIPVYYADQRARELMVSDDHLKGDIRQLLGDKVWLDNGQLDRAWIASVVFADEILLGQLNALVHPAVARDVDRWFLSLEAGSTVPYALEEAALLVESGAWANMDALIVVTCPRELRIQRVMERDNVGRSEVEARMARQLTEEEKIEKATYLIQNDGERSLTHQVFEIHRKILST